MPRIYLECSQTATNLHHTGIQRVVRNVVLNHVKAASVVGVEAAPAQYLGRIFFAFDWKPSDDSSASIWGKFVKRRISSSDGRTVPENWRSRFNAVLDRAKRAVRFKKVRRRFRSLWLNRFGIALQPHPGDLMVLVDLTLGRRVWPAIEDWRRQGGKVAVVVYDILPITNPEFFLPKLSGAFADWFDKVCMNADLLLAISDTVRDQLRVLVGQKAGSGAQESPQVESFRLGAELDMWYADAYVRPLVRTAFDPASGLAPYLMVGTIEPRKNHLTALDAFDRLWERGMKVRLVVVGRLGWKFDAIERRLRTHPRLGQGLHWFPDLSDTGRLGHCYRHAKAIVFPSWGEGYGLPIVEGLQHGLPVIASDLPVHREVAGDFAAYFDPAKSEALAEWIERLETLGALPGVRPAEYFRAVSWYEGTADLLQRCRDFIEAQGAPRFQARKALEPDLSISSTASVRSTIRSKVKWACTCA